MRRNDVDVWLCSLSTVDASTMAPLLSIGERERAERFRFERDRTRFIVARGVLRTLLSRYVQCDPCSLRFTFGMNGKPLLPNGEAFFNVSHSADIALYVVSREFDCGIDVEQIKPTLDLEVMAQRFFSRRECLALSELTGDAQTEAFFRCWTRKEALVKATGIGLSLPLHSFDVPVQIDGLPCETFVNSQRWWLHEAPVPSGYAGALAVASEHAVITYRHPFISEPNQG